MDVKHTQRKVIERKLLAAITDEDKVCIVASRSDLNILIEALGHLPNSEANRMREDLRRLRAEAFE